MHCDRMSGMFVGFGVLGNTHTHKQRQGEGLVAQRMGIVFDSVGRKNKSQRELEGAQPN